MRQITPNGRLKLTPLGGMNPNNSETENCRILRGMERSIPEPSSLPTCSIHVEQFNHTKRSYDSMKLF